MTEYLVPIVIATLQLVSFLAYGWDKRRAAKARSRTPEKTLLLLSFFGPLGAFFGIRYWRHKSRKVSYLVRAIPLMVIGFAGLSYLLYLWWGGEMPSF